MTVPQSTGLNFSSLKKQVAQHVIGGRRTVLDIETADTRGYVSLTPMGDSIRVSSGLHQFYLNSDGIDAPTGQQLSVGDDINLSRANQPELDTYLRIVKEITSRSVQV